LVRVKAYKPPKNVESTILALCKEVLGQNFQEKNFQETPLNNPLLKFNLLTKCITAFNHNISNTALNDMKNVGDLINYYLTEQRDTSTLEDISNRPDLPKNLHINLEYNRFNPETDTFFNGRDAFAGRHTIVPSLWYSKKYKPVYKKKQVFTK
jgi:large subunit ribosomal protein L50